MNTLPNPQMLDEENPEWQTENFMQAQPASLMLPLLFPNTVAHEMLQPQGSTATLQVVLLSSSIEC